MRNVILKTIFFIIIINFFLSSTSYAQTVVYPIKDPLSPCSVSNIQGGFSKSNSGNFFIQKFSVGVRPSIIYYRVMKLQWNHCSTNSINYILDIMNESGTTVLATMFIPKEAIIVLPDNTISYELNNAQTFFSMPALSDGTYRCRLKSEFPSDEGTTFYASYVPSPTSGGTNLYVYNENVDTFIATGSGSNLINTRMTFNSNVKVSLYVNTTLCSVAMSSSLSATNSTIGSVTNSLEQPNEIYLRPTEAANAILKVSPTLSNNNGTYTLRFNITKVTSNTIPWAFPITTAATWSIYVVVKNTNNTIESVYKIDLNNAGGVISGKQDLSFEAVPQLSCSPNLFDNETKINFTQTEADNTSLQLYNTNGQLVQSILNNTYQEAGTYSYTLAAADLPKGMYILLLQSGRNRKTEKIMKL
ncbi:MAG: T9SS type A sorting domain-containing protein [Chitinophagales bacterium]|nr:T9SS type A sorting domain-containing protein [Chitinophagales bacterium]